MKLSNLSGKILFSEEQSKKGPGQCTTGATTSATTDAAESTETQKPKSKKKVTKDSA